MQNKITLFKKGSSIPDAKQIRINCLGDSITNGHGSNVDPEDPINAKGSYMPYYRWWEREYEVKAENCGQNGSFVADYEIDKCDYPNNSVPFVKRYLDMPDNADMITILGGVNDCHGGHYTKEEFGALEDTNYTNPHAFCGALRTMLGGIKSKFPNAQIVYLSPLKYSDKSEGLGAKWNNSKHLGYYVDAIQAICKEFDVPFIDLYSPKELHFCCDNVDDALMYGDRLHFGWKAHKILGEYIIKQMEEMGIIEIISDQQ